MYVCMYILPDIASRDSHKKLDARVLYSKQGRGVIDVTCQSSIQVIVQNQCSLSFRSSSNVCATHSLQHSHCGHSHTPTLVMHFSPQFLRKRETAQFTLTEQLIGCFITVLHV